MDTFVLNRCDLYIGHFFGGDSESLTWGGGSN